MEIRINTAMNRGGIKQFAAGNGFNRLPTALQRNRLNGCGVTRPGLHRDSSRC